MLSGGMLAKRLGKSLPVICQLRKNSDGRSLNNDSNSVVIDLSNGDLAAFLLVEGESGK